MIIFFSTLNVTSPNFLSPVGKSLRMLVSSPPANMPSTSLLPCFCMSMGKYPFSLGAGAAIRVPAATTRRRIAKCFMAGLPEVGLLSDVAAEERWSRGRCNGPANDWRCELPKSSRLCGSSIQVADVIQTKSRLPRLPTFAASPPSFSFFWQNPIGFGRRLAREFESRADQRCPIRSIPELDADREPLSPQVGPMQNERRASRTDQSAGRKLRRVHGKVNLLARPRDARPVED